METKILPWLLGVGALVGAYFAFGRSANANPFGSLPAGLLGTPNRLPVTAKSGSEYTTDTWPPNALDDVYVVAHLEKLAGPVSTPSGAWIGYWSNRKSEKRRFRNGYAPGDKLQADAVMGQMRNDFGVGA